MKELFPFYSIGHFINEPGNPTEFEITRFDEMVEPEVDDLHKHTFYEIIWIEEGMSRQVIDYQEHVISPGMLFFISPGQLHEFEEWQPLRGGSIFFTEDFFLLNHVNKDKLFELIFLDNFYVNPYLKPDPSSYAEIKHTIDWLLAERKRADYSESIARSLLHVLLAQIQRCVEAQSQLVLSKKYLVLYKTFKNLIDTHFRESLTVRAYAEKLHITPHHLNLVARHVTGKTASELIRTRSVLEAKRLLVFTDHSVSEIAAELGFFDSSYFARLFKAETGTSPGEFKKAMSEKYRTT